MRRPHRIITTISTNMRTFKRCAVSNDNPDYLLRNPYMLVKQDGHTYFRSAERAAYKIASPRPMTRINVEMKFGVSRDSPHIGRYTPVNRKTPELFVRGFSTSRPFVFSSHLTIRECMRKSRGNTERFNGMMLRTQSREGSPLLPRNRRATSQEGRLFNTFSAAPILGRSPRNAAGDSLSARDGQKWNMFATTEVRRSTQSGIRRCATALKGFGGLTDRFIVGKSATQEPLARHIVFT